MKAVESADALISFSMASGTAIRGSRVLEGLKQMLAFYECVKASGCDGMGSDMLLFQWGVYDWGKGQFFEMNITRQFIENDRQGDDAISQLSLTFKYLPAAELIAIEAGNQWFDGREELNAFRDFIFSSAPVLATLDKNPEYIELAHFYV